jgi:hypothetical protein
MNLILREKIQKIAERAFPEETRHLACFLFEDKFHLSEKGGFDDDPEMLALLKNNSPEMSERVNHFLSR